MKLDLTSIFFFSFRETIADFLNYYMKPVEPMVPENVCVL